MSAYNITHINRLDQTETTITPALVWLWERYRYNCLTKQFSCFSDFRKWRTFHCWWANVQEEKRRRILYYHFIFNIHFSVLFFIQYTSFSKTILYKRNLSRYSHSCQSYVRSLLLRTSQSC